MRPHNFGGRLSRRPDDTRRGETRQAFGPRRRGEDSTEAFMGNPREFGFGRGPRGGGPGRGRRGDVRNAILALLTEQAMNGYQIIMAVSERTNGLWRPGPGSVYPALGLLTDEGLIEPVDADGKKVFRLTDAGGAFATEHADELKNPWDEVAGPHAGLLDVRKEMVQLSMAIKQVAMAGDPAQVTAARAVLDEARKSLYRILAGDNGEDDSTVE